MVELVRVLSSNYGIHCLIITMDDVIHFKKQIPDNVEVKILKRKYFKKDISIFLKFMKLAFQFSPDLIHAWGKMPAFYAFPSKLVLKIPIINSQISDSMPLDLTLNKFVFSFSDYIIANSYAGLRAYHAPIQKSEVIYNGFDFNRILNLESDILVRSKFDLKTGLIIGMVASFSEFKDYNTFLKAAITVLQEFKNVYFLCVGSGKKDTYINLIPDKLLGNFKFLDQQNDIESIINIFDIGVLSTYTEGISNSIMEYMALGKPVIATEGGGTAELVIDKVTGFLIAPKDECSMAEKMLLLILDKEKRMTMGQAGKERIRNEFSIEIMIQKHLSIYQKAIS